MIDFRYLLLLRSVIYTTSTNKLSEHGGFAHDDVNVALMLMGSNLQPMVSEDQVETTQASKHVTSVLYRGLPVIHMIMSRANKASLHIQYTTASTAD
jgi:hypothetical protein